MSEPTDAGVSQGQLPSLLFEEPPGARELSGDRDADSTFARDLNLDQIVSAIAADSEQRDLIAKTLLRPLRDAGAVRYRQEVFRDLDDPVLFSAARDFAGRMSQVRAHLRQLTDMGYRQQREGWLLEAASVYCDAVESLAGRLASAQVSSRALLAFQDYLASYVSSAAFTVLSRETRGAKAALRRVRYCTRVRGGRVDVSRYQGEADYSAVVLSGIP